MFSQKDKLMINIFLKKGRTAQANGQTYTDTDCICTGLSESEARAILGDAVESVIDDRQFHPQAHAHRFSGYKHLKKEAA